LIGAVALPLGALCVVLIAPAANAATTPFELDCGEYANIGSNFPVVPGDNVTFTLINCNQIEEYIGGVEPAPIAGVPATTIVADAGDQFVVGNTGIASLYFVGITEAAPETVPDGSLLYTADITIPLGASEITVANNSDGGGEHLLNELDECGIESSATGVHVYATLDITVNTAGTYTFRGIASTPAGRTGTPFGAFDPIQDPFLALYTSFDPAHPDLGTVGCNDDADSLGPEYDLQYTADGTFIDGHQPYVVAPDLSAGRYTLVLMTYEELSAAEMASGYSASSDQTFAIGPKTDTFQLWGPVDGLTVGEVDPAEVIVDPPAEPTLPSTGGESAPFWIGLMGVGLGAVLVVAVGIQRRSGRR
jgi:LPXTG-motif cell wall-anchored protein